MKNSQCVAVLGYGVKGKGEDVIVFWCPHCDSKHRFYEANPKYLLDSRVERCVKPDSPLDKYGFRIDMLGYLNNEDDINPAKRDHCEMHFLPTVFKIVVGPKCTSMSTTEVPLRHKPIISDLHFQEDNHTLCDQSMANKLEALDAKFELLMVQQLDLAQAIARLKPETVQ